MQQIERYGVIALVFLLVTIVAISFWGDSKSPGFWSRLTGKNQKSAEVVKVDPSVLPPQISDPNLALSPATPIDVPQPVGSLGGPQPMTTIDQAATGLTTIQAPDATVAIGAQPPLVNPGLNAVPTQPGMLPNAQPMSMSNDIVAPPASATNEYVVQRGDSLARIARNRLGAESRWQEIAALNPRIDPKSLNVGQKLLLPEGAAPVVTKNAPHASEPKVAPKSTAKPVVASATKKSDKPAAANGACIVQKGDTLRSIARRELGDERRWKEIASANPGLDPAKLAIGMRVKLPQKGGELLASASTPSSANVPAPSAKPRVR